MTNTNKLAVAAGMHNVNGTGGSKTEKELTRTCFLLLEPKTLCNSGEIARRLARCKGVKEVHLTSGKYGFVVTTSTGDALRGITSEIGRLKEIKSAYIAVSHLVQKL